MQCSAMQCGYVCMLHVCMYTYWRIMLPTCPHRTFPYPNIYPSFFWQEGPSGRHRFGPVTVVCFCFTIYRTQNGCGKWNPSLNQSTRRKSGTPQKKWIYVMIAPSFSLFLSHWFHFFFLSPGVWSVPNHVWKRPRRSSWNGRGDTELGSAPRCCRMKRTPGALGSVAARCFPEIAQLGLETIWRFPYPKMAGL